MREPKYMENAGGIGTCLPCKAKQHSRCNNRAWDDCLDIPCPCFCRAVEHRTDDDWKRIFR